MAQVSKRYLDHFGHVGCVPVSQRFEFGFINGSSLECARIMLVLLCLLQDELESQVRQVVDVRSSCMLERLRRKDCKSPHVSAMRFQHRIFPSIERNCIMHVDHVPSEVEPFFAF